jgi:hypothetical protein
LLFWRSRAWAHATAGYGHPEHVATAESRRRRGRGGRPLGCAAW